VYPSLESLMGRMIMMEKAKFFILTAEGMVTLDTFILADPQPQNIKVGCVLVIHEESGRLLTVHQTRLIPFNNPAASFLKHQHKSVCLKCGRVEGIVLDQVDCPYKGQCSCGLIEAKT
jgi:hypothetical protein